MVFSSLIFLWIFLPVVFILYFTAKEQYRNIILLIASLFFYAWGEPVYVFVMMLSIVINYFCGLKIGVEDEHKRKRALFWGVFVNLAGNVVILQNRTGNQLREKRNKQSHFDNVLLRFANPAVYIDQV